MDLNKALLRMALDLALQAAQAAEQPAAPSHPTPDEPPADGASPEEAA